MIPENIDSQKFDAHDVYGNTMVIYHSLPIYVMISEGGTRAEAETVIDNYVAGMAKRLPSWNNN